MTLLAACPTAFSGEEVFPGRAWLVRRPEQVGLDSSMLDAFAARVGGDGVVVRGGYLVKTWGGPTLGMHWL